MEGILYFGCDLREVSAKDFVEISLEGFYVCGQMKLVASLSCLEYIVCLVGVNHPIRPAVLPSQSTQLASVVFGSFVAQSPNVIPGAGVDGDASKIINGVGMAEDHISIRIAVLLCRVHSVAVAVCE